MRSAVDGGWEGISLPSDDNDMPGSAMEVYCNHVFCRFICLYVPSWKEKEDIVIIIIIVKGTDAVCTYVHKLQRGD